MAESGINVSALSYSKMILHAVKFPHCAVSGVLVGRRLNNDIDVTDAVPAMHSVVLAPPMEILFIQLDAYCREKQLDIVGLYFANQVLANKSLDDTLLRIAAEKIPNPVILQIDNSKLALNAVAPCLRAFRQDGTIKWREVEFSVDNLDDTLALTSFAIQNKFHRGLVDFENHLDEPLAADFYNLDLNEKLFQINEL